MAGLSESFLARDCGCEETLMLLAIDVGNTNVLLGVFGGVILGSVVPPLTGTFRAMVHRYFGVAALIVEPGVNTSMPILYENPSEVGADRIVNAVAAYEKFGKDLGRPLIVVDFGTATTLAAITAKCEYLRGAI